MNLEKNKYVDIAFSIIAVVFLIWLISDYDNLVYSDHMPTGKAAKKMRLILIILDKAVGKFWSILILSSLAFPFIYRTFKKITKNKKKTTQKRQKNLLSVNDKFSHGNYKVYVKEITSTEKGFSGKGWVEMGIVNKVKKPIEFSNIELNEDFVSVKGDLVFLDDE